jgi:hypothetical protein
MPAFTGMRAKWQTCFVLVLVGACSGGPAKEPGSGMPTAGTGVPDSGISGAGGNAWASGQGSGGSSAGTSFRVSFAATKTRVCSGECVSLTAEAANGHEPYAYAWSGGLDDSPGPHEVCPEETTTYEVTATDTGIEGEFGRASQHTTASLELRVDERCVPTDGGVTEDGSVDEAPGTAVLCSVHIPYGEPNWITAQSGWEGNSNLATDAEGNLYLAGAFRGTFDLGAQTITSVGDYDGLLLKYDESCRLVWAKTYGAAGSHIFLGGVAVDPDGGVVVGGSIMGSADFGRGVVTSGLNGSGLLMRVEVDDGAVVWNEVYGSLFNGATIWGVGVDQAGDITISGYASADASFGGPTLGGAQTGNIAFIAKLTRDAQHRFSFGVHNADLLAPFAVHPSGVIALSGWTQGRSVTVAGLDLTLGAEGWKRYIAMINEHGELMWGRAFTDREVPGTDGVFVGFWGGGLAIDADRNVVVEHGIYREDDTGMPLEYPERISKVDDEGMLVWTADYSLTDSDDLFYSESGVAIDSRRNILHSDGETIAGDSGREPDAGVATRNRLFLQKLNPDGEIIWRHPFEAGRMQWAWGITTAPDDAVWFTYAQEGVPDAPGTAATLVIAKLAP